MSSPKLITRFAPSPTGRLHIGHSIAAAAVFDFAKRHNGTGLLRIENIDHTRCRPEFTEGIYGDLAWLGYEWPKPTRIQSQHTADYAEVVCDLIDRGLAYPCALTRTELKADKTPDLENNSDQSLSYALKHASKTQNPTLPFNIRLNLNLALQAISDQSLTYTELQSDTALDAYETRNARPSLTAWAASDRPDPVIVRRDIGCSYHIAVTHDDHLQGVTHVVRGADFIDQTPLHVLIQRLMGWSTPTYYHHPLVTDNSGRKLSKSARDLTLESLRESGVSPTDVLSRSHGPL